MEILRVPAFDWLTFSTDDLSYSLREEELEIRSRVMDKGNGPMNWIEKSGFDENGIYEYLLSNCDLERVSRFDVCIDVRLNSFEDISNYKPLVKRLKFKKYLESFGSGGGRTYYFGSNDLILRIYEKGGQLKKEDTDYLRSWVRFEFQLKGRLARDYVRTSIDAVELFGILASKYLDIEFEGFSFSKKS